MRNTVRILQLVVARKAIQHQCKALISFHIARSFKVFIENRTNDIA